jgi:ribosomal protein L7/L12
MDTNRIAYFRHVFQTAGLTEQLLAFELGVTLALPTNVDVPEVHENWVFSNAHLRSLVKTLARNPIVQGKRIQIIKIVCDLSGLGLKEAKDLVDDVYRSLPEEFHFPPGCAPRT